MGWGPRALPNPCLPSGRNSLSSELLWGLLKSRRRTRGDEAQFQRGKCGEGAVQPFLLYWVVSQGRTQAWKGPGMGLEASGAMGAGVLGAKYTRSLMLSQVLPGVRALATAIGSSLIAQW